MHTQKSLGRYDCNDQCQEEVSAVRRENAEWHLQFKLWDRFMTEQNHRLAIPKEEQNAYDNILFST